MIMIKGKRSKRSRTPSPSVTDEGGSGVSEEWTVGVAKSTVTEEEHEMAQCLILLAQGPNRPIKRKVIIINDKNNNNYECKTCNRSFPSFQALGGHRTSHKKPKIINSPVQQHPKKSSTILSLLKNSNQIKEKLPKVEKFNDVSLTLQMGNNNTSASSAGIIISKAKVHDCNVCGAEFSSGQALGGHMRRHRPIVTTAPGPTLAMNVLSLDLNLPAPEEDNSSKFVFGLNEKTLVFTAPSLVDCHY